jgi:uncharacterized protein YjdB
LAPDGTYTFTLSYSPANTTEKGVKWESSNTSVATVADGTVTAVAVGTATITARSTAKSNIYATCSVTVTDPIPLTGIALDRTSVNLIPNGTTTLTVTYDPADTTESGVAWTSSNTNVATVSGGTITAVAVGTATITATSTEHSSMTATCSVTVTATSVPLTGITLDRTSVDLNPNGTALLTVTYNPAATTEAGVTWTSSNTNVATVSGGTVTAVGVGTATITARSTAHSNLYANCSVTVTNLVLLTGICLDRTSVDLNPNGTATLAVIYSPSATTETGVAWTSSNTNVAIVSGGTVTAVGVGTAIITATSAAHSNLYATCSVTVTEASVPLIGISLNQASLNLDPNGTATLAVTYNPSDTTETGVTWTSSDVNVATVTNGTVTAVGGGTATITATSTAHSSMTATCSVTVAEASVPLKGISLNTAALALNKGQEQTLTVTYDPSNTTESGVTWTSNDTAVATVVNGVVTAVGGGSTTITATSTAHSNMTASANVTVTVPLTGISLTPNPLTITGTGTTGSFTVNYDPPDTTEKGVTWTSNNTAVSTVNTTTGVITTVAGGEAPITARSATHGSITASATVNVVVPLIGISLSYTTLDLSKGQQEWLAITYNPSTTTETGVIWSNSNSAVARFSGGPDGRTITAVGGGTAIITVKSTANDSILATCNVTVAIPLTGINLPSTLTLGIGGTYLLPAAYIPADTTQTELTWNSADPNVATVTNGTITAAATGSTTITATSTANGGIFATCDVTVQSSFDGAEIDIVFEGPTDQTITLAEPVREGDMLTVTAPSGFDRYLWYLDSSSQGETTNPTASVPVWYITPGLHYLTVIVEKGGNHFSKTLKYRVGY